MEHQLIQELRALLFGEKPYFRYGAPEPEMLVTLAPVLPEAVIGSALHAIRHIGVIGEYERFRTLIMVLENVAVTSHDAILAELVIDDPSLVQNLPESLLARTHVALSELESGDSAARDKALAQVVLRMEAKPIQDDREQATQEIDLPEFSPWSAAGPAKLALCLPLLSETQIATAWETFGNLEPGAFDWEPGVIAMMAPFLPNALLSQALDLARYKSFGGGTERTRARILLDLAPYLPQSLIPDTLAIARTLEEQWWQIRALAALLPHLPEEEQAVVAARRAAMSDERIRRLWLQLAEEQQVKLGKEIIDSIWDHYGGAAPEASKKEARQRSERLVNTGFAKETQPDDPLDPAIPLLQDKNYYFWFQVGERVDGAIDTEDVELPEDLPEGARLQVALFAFEHEIGITPGADFGEIYIQPDGCISVERRVAEPRHLKDVKLLDRRIFFPVTTPNRTGTFRLRCNIYYKQVLIQSHLVHAEVVSFEEWLKRRAINLTQTLRRDLAQEPALWTVLDYALNSTLHLKPLARLEAHNLSIMLNDNNDGTHGFRFFGTDGEELFKGDASLDTGTLTEFIDTTRSAMRKATWGNENDWNKSQHYSYKDQPDPDRLRRARAHPERKGLRLPRLTSSQLDRLQEDLSYLATKSKRIHGKILDQLASAHAEDNVELRDQTARLERITQKTGHIQVASKKDLRCVMPLSVLYDYHLDDTVDQYELCPGFLQALEDGRPLAQAECFQGHCPQREKDIYNTILCPSGFWGYRHSIGMPFSIGRKQEDTANVIQYRHEPTITLAVSTDPKFKLREDHENALQSLRKDIIWEHAANRVETMKLLGLGESHIVYFYCHGGLTRGDKAPYLMVGESDRISIVNLRDSKILWLEPRPLVFLNGCHTTALDPRHAYDLLTRFAHMNAAGVIGTEITIYEPLAVSFAEECLSHFLNGEAIGEAVRLARLKLLQYGNPLGLVYDLFAVASLAMVKTA